MGKKPVAPPLLAPMMSGTYEVLRRYKTLCTAQSRLSSVYFLWCMLYNCFIASERSGIHFVIPQVIEPFVYGKTAHVYVCLSLLTMKFDLCRRSLLVLPFFWGLRLCKFYVIAPYA